MKIMELPYGDKAAWLQLRQRYIGGSDASSVTGNNRYKSAYTLWAEKTGKRAPFEGNLTTEVGLYLEDFVARLFTRETGKKVRKKNRVLVNAGYPFACANIDRMVVGEKALLEIKTTNSLPLLRALKAGGDAFPAQYYTQCVHYLAVTGLDKCYLAVLLGCRELKLYALERDEGEITKLMDAEAAFWRLVQEGTPPAVDGSEDCAETLAALYPQGTDGASVSLAGLEEQLKAYLSLGAQIKELKTAQNAAANEIKQGMGKAAYGSAGPYKASWTNISRTTFDRALYDRDHPGEDLSPYYKTGSTRTFRVTQEKQKTKTDAAPAGEE